MNSPIVNRIKGVLESQFTGLIDIADFHKHPTEQQESIFLTRSLAALCIKDLAAVDAKTAAQSVVDGFDDGGIDAIHFDATADCLYFIQSKWATSPNASFDEASAAKFVNGVKMILADKFDRLNDKIRAKEPVLREALYSTRDVRIRLVTIHTAKQGVAKHVGRLLDDLVKELNDPIPIADYQDLPITAVYELITAESKDPKITIQAVLNDWGVIDRPYLAYYGRVPLETIAGWWKEHRNRLFTQNLRLYYQNSAINEALKRTMLDEPDHFWYYNNGITIIADKVVKGVAGSPAHKFANFACFGASVVNGAQTVGTIGSNADPDEDNQSKERKVVWVQVRLISLENCPPDFGRHITRAANLQNAVGNREFAAMDPLQHQLAIEFSLDKRRYVYKSGELDPFGEEGCSIVEATQALACVHSIGLAVLVKRNLGLLWADTERPPYTELFHKELSADRVWRAVKVLRAVDDEVRKLRSSDVPRADLCGTHMQRVVLHLVLQEPEIKRGVNGVGSVQELTDLIPAKTAGIFADVARYIDRMHPSDYLANLSKNTDKCEQMARNYKKPQAVVEEDRQQTLPGLDI